MTLVVDANGELTLPRSLLDGLGVRPGQTVTIDLEEVEIDGLRHPYLVVRSADSLSEILIAAPRPGRSSLQELIA